MSEIDNLLDSTLDDLEDLPEFKPFAAGAHRVSLSLSQKQINDVDCVEASLKMIENLELADPNLEEEDIPKPGDEASSLFMLNNEFGRGNLKRVLAALADTIGSRNNREIIEGAKDIECIVITSIKLDKKDSDKKYLNIKELQVA